MKRKKLWSRIRQYLVIFCCILMCTGCGRSDADKTSKEQTAGVSYDWAQMEQTGSMELQYARQFCVDYYEGGYSLITIADTDRFLVVPEQMPVPDNLESDIAVLQLPIRQVYLVSSASMDMFRELDALDIIGMTGTKRADWSIPEIRQKMQNGDILYSGKYSAPDYEMIVEQGCDLAIESTMIYHTPGVKEQLEQLGIPVLVERSSYEAEPLGRVEWIRLYGMLSETDAAAQQFMEDCSQRMEKVLSQVQAQQTSGAEKTAAFFYVSSNGYVNVRKPGDYISKMIQIAGGQYVFADMMPEEDNALSTMNMQMETFYKQAVNADYLIYNSTIDGELTTIAQLLEKSPLFADFKAVKEGNVWCTGKNMFQETTGAVGMMEDFYAVFHGAKDKQLTYLHRLE